MRYGKWWRDYNLRIERYCTWDQDDEGNRTNYRYGVRDINHTIQAGK